VAGQPDAREGQAGPLGVAEGSVVPMKPGNAGGGKGIDRQEFADIEADGEDRWLGQTTDTLRRKTYRTEAARRVWLPKAEGNKLRPLGIPRIADRVVMTAATVVLGARACLHSQQQGRFTSLQSSDSRLKNGGQP
jgi:hypothetical protein